MKLLRFLIIFSLPVVVFLLSDCKKGLSNGQLSFSEDTLTFDTVFTSLGSTTKYFKVYNNDRKAVRINNIRLMHLVGTQFRIKVDGRTGDNLQDIEIPAKDSIYVFVEVTVEPNSDATPFVIIDDVQFETNENVQTVHLQAFGQNAHFHYGEEIASGQTSIWTNDLPHVILGKGGIPGVFVSCGATLKINPGCKVYFAGGAAMFVQGTLSAVATDWNDSIVFQGVRLEEFYEDKPGQWFAVVFLRDSNPGCVPKGTFDHCIINESSYGIYAGAGLSDDIDKYRGEATRPQVIIKNTIVKNALYNAVQGFNAKITAENSLFYAAGDNLVTLGLGGDYSFNYCTLFNNGSAYVGHQKEVLLLSNFVVIDRIAYREPLTTAFTNSIIYGNLDNEISFNNIDDLSLTNFNNTFSYSLIKGKSDTVGLFSAVDNNLFNSDPRFIIKNGNYFTPSDSAGFISPALDFCPAGPIGDIFGQFRPVSKTINANKYDIGAVEAQ